MGRLKVGVMIESFRMGVKGGIKKAAELGVEGFQVYVTRGELAPWNMGKSARREFRHFVDGLGLTISALCGDLGHGYTDPSKMDELLGKSKSILDLSADLRVGIVTTHIGVIPEDESHPTRPVLTEALEELGAYAEKVGSVFATETGPEDPALMRRFLDSLNTEAVRVNYDPANLVMRGFDHVQGVRDLAPYIVHTHAKDGVRTPEGQGKEVPLGEGGVDWPAYLGALEEAGYRGFFAIEREVGENPVADISKAVAFLRRF
jgi:sugar phosphate isomerase/epimerase